MFTKAIIHRCPTGRFKFVGRVPSELCNKTWATEEDAKAAAIDVMIERGETFAVSN